MTPCDSNVYTKSDMEIISPSMNVHDLGLYMSCDCTFNYHISSLSKKSANLSGWILRTFYNRDCITMLTLFKSIVLTGINDMPYHERLKSLGLYSLQRRRERYGIIYI